MLLNLHKKGWQDGLTLDNFKDHSTVNEKTVTDMVALAKAYNKAIEEEEKLTPQQLAIKNVGKQDPKRHLEESVDSLMTSNIVQSLGTMMSNYIFK